MPLFVIPLALVAAVFHASWNAVLKASENPIALAARAATFGTILSVPPVGVAWLLNDRPGLPLSAWLLALGSATLELIYFNTLSLAYQRGELSLVYPIARGTAPLLAVAVGLALLGERVSGAAIIGIICLLGGMWAIRRPSPAGSALVPALLTGVIIAAYSSLDRLGVRLGPPWLYGFVLWVLIATFLVGFTSLRGIRDARLTVDPRTSLFVGALMTAAYYMILIALSVAPLAIVAPLRESAIVLVTAWGIWRLRERKGAWIRVAGALAIVAGIALLTLA